MAMNFPPSTTTGSSTAGSPAESHSSINPEEGSVRDAQIVTATVSMTQQQQKQNQHPLHQRSDTPSSVNLNDAYGGIDIVTTAASPQTTPSPPKRVPLPIETAGHNPYAGGAALSPILGSPQSAMPESSPIASSHIASAPQTPNGRAPPVPTRNDSASTASAASERMNTIVRREILQGVRVGAAQRAATKDRAVAAGLPLQTPQTPAFFPDRITNYHPSPASTAVERTPNVPVDTWSLFDGSSSIGHGQGSTSPSARADADAKLRHMSANSGRRLSDITAGDAEWKELQMQLKWEQQ